MAASSCLVDILPLIVKHAFSWRIVCFSTARLALELESSESEDEHVDLFFRVISLILFVAEISVATSLFSNKLLECLLFYSQTAVLRAVFNSYVFSSINLVCYALILVCGMSLFWVFMRRLYVHIEEMRQSLPPAAPAADDADDTQHATGATGANTDARALCFVHCALCAMLYVVRSMVYGLCSLVYALCSLCSMLDALYSMLDSLWSVACRPVVALNHVFCLLTRSGGRFIRTGSPARQVCSLHGRHHSRCVCTGGTSSAWAVRVRIRNLKSVSVLVAYEK